MKLATTTASIRPARASARVTDDNRRWLPATAAVIGADPTRMWRSRRPMLPSASAAPNQFNDRTLAL